MDWKEIKDRAKALAKNANDQTVSRAKDIDWKELKEKAKCLAKKANAQADQLAEKVAVKTSQLTGKAVTKEHVKRVAITVGVIVAAGAVMESMSADAGSSVAAADCGAGGVEGYDGFDDSFEGQSHEFFADKGGLNIETVTLDIDGCEI